MKKVNQTAVRKKMNQPAKTFKRVIDPLILRIGQRIAALRKEDGMTIAALAKKLGTSGSSLGQIENGWRRPSSKYLDKVARTLGVDSTFLLTGVSERHLKAARRDYDAWNAIARRSA